MKIINIEGKRYGIAIGSLIRQPIGDFFVCSMTWSVLNEIAISQPRILVSKNEDGTEEYRGIQRFVSEERRKALVEYVTENPYATFPTSIIINFPSEFLDLIPFKVSLSQADNLPVYNNDILDKLPNDESLDSHILVFPIENGVAQIIDGQHRLSAFQSFGDQEVFDLPVTIFMNQTLERQAEVFAVINGKQTKVSASLVYELFGISEKPTPYKVANDLLKMLNESENSPLEDKIKILGKANEYYKGVITQSTIAQNIIFLISGDIKQAEKDKSDVLNGMPLEPYPTKTRRPAPLREFYINREENVLFKVILNFFKAVEEGFGEKWSMPDSVLQKTIGINALFKYLSHLAILGKQQNTLTYVFFLDHIKTKQGIDLTNVQLSSKGVNQIADQLIDK